MPKAYLDRKILYEVKKSSSNSNLITAIDLELAASKKLHNLTISKSNFLVGDQQYGYILKNNTLGSNSASLNRSIEILSLNCGAFDTNSFSTQNTKRYEEVKKMFLNYTQNESKNKHILMLQDMPDDQEVFDYMNGIGFDLYFFPYFYYSESEVYNIKQSGILYAINNKLVPNSYEIEFDLYRHEGAFNDYSQYDSKFSYKDLIVWPISVYCHISILQNLYTLSTTHVSPFSDQPTRVNNITQSLNALSSLAQEKKSSRWILAGDCNPYGINTLKGCFGLSAAPWNFGPVLALSVISKLFSMRSNKNKVQSNPLSNKEVKMLEKRAYLNGYIVQNNNQNIDPSMYLQVHQFIPNPFKKLFFNIVVPWQLDLCFVPDQLVDSVITSIDKEPFGNFDHYALHVTIT